MARPMLKFALSAILLISLTTCSQSVFGQTISVTGYGEADTPFFAEVDAVLDFWNEVSALEPPNRYGIWEFVLNGEPQTTIIPEFDGYFRAVTEGSGKWVYRFPDFTAPSDPLNEINY